MHSVYELDVTLAGNTFERTKHVNNNLGEHGQIIISRESRQ